MTTFALVHGAWHGAWCWERLVGELERLGHAAVAVDLPSDDSAATFYTYADVVAGALGEAGPDVVVVGHSLGGLTIPLVAERRPVRALVYLAALLPRPQSSLADQFRAEPGMLIAGYERGLSEPDDQRRRRWVDVETARRTLYHDCDEEDVRAAFGRLRPQATTGYREPCPLEAMPDVPTAYVVCTEDRMVDPAWSRRAARLRLGVEPVELDGGHSPFLARPAALAGVLADLVPAA